MKAAVDIVVTFQRIQPDRDILGWLRRESIAGSNHRHKEVGSSDSRRALNMPPYKVLSAASISMEGISEPVFS